MFKFFKKNAASAKQFVQVAKSSAPFVGSAVFVTALLGQAALEDNKGADGVERKPYRYNGPRV